MKDRIKRIIAIILCIVLVFEADNISACYDTFKYIGNHIITKADTRQAESDRLEEQAEEMSSGETPTSESDAQNIIMEQDETSYIDGDGTVESIEEDSTVEENKPTENTKGNKYSETENSENIEEDNFINEDTKVINDVQDRMENVKGDNAGIPSAFDDAIGMMNNSVVYNIEYLSPLDSNSPRICDVDEFVVGGTYRLETYDDWKKLFEISKDVRYNGLAGMTFVVYYRNMDSSLPWELTDANVGRDKVLGSATNPFRGTIYCFSSTTKIYTNKLLFTYLSSNAHVGQAKGNATDWFNIYYTSDGKKGSPTKNIKAGLAEMFILEDESDTKQGCEVYIGPCDGKKSNFYVNVYQGTISDSSNIVGGLFASVSVGGDKKSPEGVTESIYKINIGENSDVFGVNLSGITDKKVTGRYAGGLIGEVSGDISISIYDYPKGITTVDGNSNVNGAYAGGMFGALKNGVVVTFKNQNPININTKVYNAGNYCWYTGGFAGYVFESKIICNTSAGVYRTGNTYAKAYAGSFVGYALNSTVEVNNYTINSGSDIRQFNDTSHRASGGVIGKYEINSDNLGTDKLELSCIKSSVKDAKTYSGIRIASGWSWDNSIAGGLVGIINSYDVEVYIHDINTDAEKSGTDRDNCYYVNMIYNRSLYDLSTSTDTDFFSRKGGIAGEICGTNIKVENVIFDYQKASSLRKSNAMSGYYIGNICAKLGNTGNKDINSKIIVKNIKILNNYVYRLNNSRQRYYGGLFGTVNSSVIELQGNIDLSGFQYKMPANSSTGTGDDVDLYALYGDLGSTGYLVGASSGSVIYKDINCVYNRPLKYDKVTGEFVDCQGNSYDMDIIEYTNNNNTNSKYRYCIDDIGNAGSLYQNVLAEDGVTKVIDITKPWGENVTGKITKEGDKYVIDSLADALRFAIAGNSVNTSGYPNFGGNCFVNDGEAVPELQADILTKDYLLKTNINMSEAGITGLVTNASIQYAFKGSIIGVRGSYPGEEGGTTNEYPTITLEFLSRQRYGGLFPNVTGMATGDNKTFANFNLKGIVGYTKGENYTDITSNHVRAGAGGLAAYATGAISIDNVDFELELKVSNNVSTIWRNEEQYGYGGAFGIYYSNNQNYSIENSEINIKLGSVRSNTYTAGMIGWIRSRNGNILNKISVKNCVLSVNLTTNTLYQYGSGSNYFKGGTSGLVALISQDCNSYIQNNVSVLPCTVDNYTYTNIEINGLEIRDTAFDYSIVGVNANPNMTLTGGLIGYAWANTKADINNVSVVNSSIKSRGTVGGLISFAAGIYNLNNITLTGLEMTSLKRGNYCGFLIGNGQNAVVNVSNYSINTNTSIGVVSATDYNTFDELVGINVRLDKSNGTEYPFSDRNNVDGYYREGGILNYIDSNFVNFDSNDTYSSYTNKVVTTTNKYTRYYYNLFSDTSKINVVDGVGQINTPEQWLTYSAASYCRTNVRRFFDDYFVGGKFANITSYKINADLDMKGYSLYSTPIVINNTIIDFDNHSVTLYADRVYDRENNLLSSGNNKYFRSNEDSSTQHYLMHVSLFNNIDNTVTIKNLRLTGIAGNIGNLSGALICRTLTGKPTISNITLDNLSIHNYSNEAAGLLIGKVGLTPYSKNAATNININNITTVNYSASAQPVAAALIAYVGDKNSTDIKIYFEKMKVEDEKGKVFKYASYIYEYNYIEDIDKNKCYIQYVFSKQDCTDDIVTYGKEISAGVQYSDQTRNESDNTDLLNIAIQNAKNDVYNPYIYRYKNIFVNPRNGDITSGCGTYEDPYIINDARQFLTLYLYLTGKQDYDTMFLGSGQADGKWKVVPVGGNDGDKTECSTGTHTAVAYQEENFPSREDLSTAYYKITTDLNLQITDDLNYINISSEYSGLGSEDIPFAGVIVGGNHTITLPKQGKSNNVQLSQSNFGLIQFMGGAVVKDLIIEGNGYFVVDGDKKSAAYYNVTTAGGGVAAIVVGGDNIIDNVKVKINFNTGALNGLSETIPHVGLGGLVGIVRDGSLVLRNMQNTNATNMCVFDKFTNTAILNSILAAMVELNNGTYVNSEELYSYSKGNYNEVVGTFVGRVLDGLVIYEGYNKLASEIQEPAVLDNNQMGINTMSASKYPLINGYFMINENVWNGSVVNNRITFSKTTDANDSNKYNYDASISNGDQLEIFTMALNSDALSVYYCADKSKNTGYNYYTRCRKASYSDVGNNDKTSTDRNFVVTFDDNKKENVGSLYPYICYKYFDYSALSQNGATDLNNSEFENNNYSGYLTTLSSVNSGNDIVSNVNKAVPDVANYTTTYTLEKNGSDIKDYDLTKYDISFRGIGALYTTSYSDFRANFNGNNNNITYRMSRSFDVNNAKYIGIKYSGLFNTLIYNTKMRSVSTNAENVAEENASKLEIKNINLKNIIVYNPYTHDVITTDSNYAQKYGIESSATGALVGKIQGYWNIENVTLTRNTAISDIDTNIISDVSGYKSVGGLVGRISSTHYTTTATPSATWIQQRMGYSNDITLINCDVNGSSSVNVKVTELGTSKAIPTNGFKVAGAGGLIGTISSNVFPHGNIWNGTRVFGNVHIKECDVDYLTVTMNDKGDLGGFVGMAGVRYKENNDDDAWGSSVGNIVVDGRTDESENSTTMSNVKHLTLTSHNAYYSSDAATTRGQLYSAGGLFGRCEMPYSEAGSISIRNYSIKDISISANTDYASYNTRYEKTANGGIIGYERCFKIDINKVELDVEDMQKNIIGSELSPSDAGGLIGMQAALTNTNEYVKELRNNAQVDINNCKVKNTKVLSKYGICGGFVGFLMNNTTNIGSDDTDNEISDSVIQSGNGSASACGGVIGEVYNDYRTRYDTLGATIVNINNISITDTDILNGYMGTGGLIGYLKQSRYQGYVNLKNCEVYSTNAVKSKIISNTYAGGILGYQELIEIKSDDTTNHWGLTMEGRIGVGTYYDTMNSRWSDLSASGINIKGKYAGGVGGRAYERYAESNTADICVANNIIYSYDTNTSNDQPLTYSGGLYGYFRAYNDIQILYNIINIKNNVIINGGNAKEIKNKDNLGTYTGGVYGYYYGNVGVSNYMPYLTLDKNSIGYYDGMDKVDGWLNVTVSGVNSSDVKLYDSTTTTLRVKNWRDIDGLSSENVGNYSLGIGQFIGGYVFGDDKAHLYVLDPKVVLDNSIGSIPVVDVGNNMRNTTSNQKDKQYHTGYPYEYRNSVHIVYMKDASGGAYADISKEGYDDTMTGIATNYPERKPKYIEDVLLSTGSKEYHFGLYESVIDNYKNLNTGIDDKATKNYNFITSDRLNAYISYNSTVASICNEEENYDNYYDLAYRVYDDNNVRENIINGVPVLMLNGLLAQFPTDAVALALTNEGGAISSDRVNAVNAAFNNQPETSTLNAFWQVSCENAYIAPNGGIHKLDSSKPEIYDNHKKSSANVDKLNRLSLEKQVYDEMYDINGEKYYTISLIKYTYTCKGSVTDNSITIYIPIFVKEKVSVDTYLRILSNEEYSLENARKIGYTTPQGTTEKVTISHDSTYTIYAEFIYDAIRNKTNFRENRLEKSLKYDADGIHFITEGTKFTLIDYQTGVTYYYTAVSGQDDTIPFSDFKDKNGNPYLQRNISSGIESKLTFNEYTSSGYQRDGVDVDGIAYSDVESTRGIGVERFFIVVEPPEDQNTGTITVSIPTNALDVNGNNVDAFFNKNSKGENKVIMECTPGPIVSLGGIEQKYEGSDEYYTYIAGKISNDTTVDIDANIRVTLKDDDIGLNPYWKYKIKGNTIDSANTDKYLELAVTLVDENNDVVKWPTGTNISLNGSPKQVLANSMVIYSYKDFGKMFEMNNVDNNLVGKCFYYDISEGNSSEPDMRWVHEDVDGRYYYYAGLNNEQQWIARYLDSTELIEEYIYFSNQLHIQLDFSIADIEDYSGKNYKVIIQLYRSDSADHPSESSASANSSSDTTVRKYSKDIAGESKKELAVSVDANDLMDLGINLYNKDKDIFNIPFMSKIDFTDMIHSSKVDADVAEMAGQKYLATYRIYKKVDTHGNNSEVGNNNISYNENIGSVISNSADYEYQILDWDSDEIPFTLYDANNNKLTAENIDVNEDVDSETKETQSVIRVIKTFTEDEIKNGIPDAENNQIRYVTNWGMKLDVDSTGMKNEDLTNYMVTVTYLPYKTSNAPINDQDAILNDFFVFTIAKLKTDF